MSTLLTIVERQYVVEPDCLGSGFAGLCYYG